MSFIQFDMCRHTNLFFFSWVVQGACSPNEQGVTSVCWSDNETEQFPFHCSVLCWLRTSWWIIYCGVASIFLSCKHFLKQSLKTVQWVRCSISVLCSHSENYLMLEWICSICLLTINCEFNVSAERIYDNLNYVFKNHSDWILSVLWQKDARYPFEELREEIEKRNEIRDSHLGGIGGQK